MRQYQIVAADLSGFVFAVAAAAAVVGVTRALKQDPKVESALAIDVAEGELVDE